MSATIKVVGATATLENGVWTCQDPAVARQLNRVSAIEEVPASDPDPERTKAEKVASVFGGHLVSCDPPERVEEGLLY